MTDYQDAKAVKKPKRWANSLDSNYETLVIGFNANLTVEEMVSFLEINQMLAGEGYPHITIPDAIRKIKIGSFTPDTFQAFQEFWGTPVTAHQMCKFPEIKKALKDEDVIDVQHEAFENSKSPDSTDTLNFDIAQPTLETLARLAQIQHLGFNIRMSELTADSMVSRIENLKSKEAYKNLCAMAQKWHIPLPNTPPNFTLSHQGNSIKKIGSAYEKAHYRTGKPRTLEAFLADPDKYGVYGVNDMKRTTVELPDHGNERINRQKQMSDYINVRNFFTVAIMSGELGFIHDEITDQVLHPTGKRASDLNPICMIKGQMYHAGPQMNGQGSIISSATEIQIAALRQHVRDTTHSIYIKSRTDSTSEQERKDMDNSRIMIFDMHLSPEILEMRASSQAVAKAKAEIENARYSNTSKNQMPEGPNKNDLEVLRKDRFGKLVFAVNGFDLTHHTHRISEAAITVASDEFPNEVNVNHKPQIISMHTSNYQSPFYQKAIREMVRHEEGYKQEPAPLHKAVHRTFGVLN